MLSRSEVQGEADSDEESLRGDDPEYEAYVTFLMDRAWDCPREDCLCTNLRFSLLCSNCGVNRQVSYGTEMRIGDWVCPFCDNLNFSWRKWCEWSDCPSKDWVRAQCGNTNYAKRKFCNMRSCGAPREESWSSSSWEWRS